MTEIKKPIRVNQLPPHTGFTSKTAMSEGASEALDITFLVQGKELFTLYEGGRLVKGSGWTTSEEAANEFIKWVEDFWDEKCREKQ